jgi:phage terminase large subunit GpA-like protein
MDEIVEKLSLSKATDKVLADLRGKFFDWVKPPPPLHIWQWAEQNRVLPGGTTQRAGPYRVEESPYVKYPQEALLDHEVHEIYLAGAAQSAKTTFLENNVGYYMVVDPSPILLVLPDERTRDAWSKDKLSRMIEQTKPLKELFEKREKYKFDTIEHKTFPGGSLTMIFPANTTALAMRPIRIVMFDEFDQVADSVGRDGSVYELARKRTQTFFDWKVIVTGTPTHIESSKIWALYKNRLTRQHVYVVPCPSCHEMIELIWKQVVWPPDEPHKARYRCQLCSYEITNAERKEAIRRGEWKCTTPEIGKRRMGFHLPGLCSAFINLEDLAETYTRAVSDEATLQKFVMSDLGIPFDGSISSLYPSDFMIRREKYESYIPEKVRVLILSVDTQDDRLECDLTGYSDGNESFSIDYFVFRGRPDQPYVWQQLDQLIVRDFFHPWGFTIPIKCTVIDSSGHFTHEVYNYCAHRRHYNVFAIKGKEGWENEVISVRPVMKKIRGTKLEVELYKVFVDEGKWTLQQRLAIKKPGPGYIHFPENETYNEIYFKQLLSEHLEKVKKGNIIEAKRWVNPSGARNEALDLKVYSLAAIKMVQGNSPPHQFYMRMEKDFERWKAIAKKRMEENENSDNDEPEPIKMIASEGEDKDDQAAGGSDEDEGPRWKKQRNPYVRKRG